MTAVLPADGAERRLAAAALDRNVVVSAGAGTGKTRLLIDRLTLLIVGREVPVEKIVALTFTKKAAEEMRDRLEKRLRALVADPQSLPLLNEEFPADGEKRAALAAKALDDIPKAQIGTIHSFAAHLLRLYPVQGEVDPAFREDDGTAFDAVFESEWRAWLGEELAEDAPRADAWRGWLAAIELSDLKALARALAALDAPSEAMGRPVDLKPALDEAIAALDALIARLGIPSSTRTFGPKLESLRRVLEAARGGERPAAGDLGAAICFDPSSLPKAWSSDGAAETTLEWIQRRAVRAAAVDEKLLRAAHAAVAPFAERLQRELGRRGVLSFDDLLLKARNLVRDHKKVRAALKAQYATFLVDEFQDTDPLQGEILFYLAEAPGQEAAHWRKAALGPGRLFVVGDPKQSIYRFRGADIAAFEEFWERLVSQDAAQASLSCNFRSEPHILATVNAVFPRVMKQERFLQPAYEALSCGEDRPLADGVETVVVSVPEGEAPTSEAQRAFEGAFIADWIERNVGKPLNGAPLRYSDVALLLRGTSAFPEYLAALRDRGIPFLTEGERGYYRRPEVMELTNLLAVIADPSDRLSLAGVLRSPIGGLTDAEIARLAEANALDVRRPPRVLKDKIGPLYAKLKALAEEAYDRPAPDVIRAALDASWLLELSAGRRHGEQAVANLRKAAQLAETWLESETLTLAGFVRRLRNYREDQKDEGENPLADVQYDAVRVMTVHKAKGLEFRVVFLPNLSATPGTSAMEPSVLVPDWRTGTVGLFLPAAGATNAARFLIDEEIARREAAEEVRVFYVAATRAKERMFFLLRERTRQASRFAGYLRDAGAFPADAAASVDLPGVRIPVTRLDWERRGPRADGVRAAFARDWDANALAAVWKRRRDEAEKNRAGRLLVTPTVRLHDLKTAVEPEKRAFAAVDEEALDRTPAILIGHICHAVMEAWPFDASARGRKKRLDETLDVAARRFGLLPENPERAAVLDECAAILETFLASEGFGAIAAAKIEGREVPFFYPLGAGDAPRLMRGVMDLVYRDAGGLVVADYKTNRVDAKTLEKVAESYRPQGAVYVEALAKITGEKAAFELVFLRTGERRRLIY